MTMIASSSRDVAVHRDPASPPARAPRSSVVGRVWALVSVRNIVATGSTLILVYLVIVPLLFLVSSSFSSSTLGRAGTRTLQLYRDVLSDGETLEALTNTMIVGFGAASLAVVLGGTYAWLVQRVDLPARRVATFLVIFPLFLPGIVGILAWILLLDSKVGVVNVWFQDTIGITLPIYSLVGMMWVSALHMVPLMFLWLSPAFAAMDPALEEAATMSGTRPRKVIRTVTLPLLRPALVGGFVVALVLAIENVLSAITIGQRADIPLLANLMYEAGSGFPPQRNLAAVYSVLMLLITMTLVIVQRKLTARGERFVTVRGKGLRPSRIPLGRWRVPVALGTYLSLVVITIVPVLTVLWLALSPFVRVPSIEGIDDLTLKWFRDLSDDPIVGKALRNSALAGGATAIVVLSLSLSIGWVLIRSRSRFKPVVDILAFAPIAVPGLVIGISLIHVYTTLPIPIYGTLYIMIVAYVTNFIPFGVRLVTSGWAQIHPELEEAGAMTGSAWGKVMRTVTMPLLIPTLVAGMIYVFYRGFVDLSASLMLYTTATETYSVAAYSFWSGGEVNKAAAFSVVGITIISLVIGTLIVVTRGKYFAERMGNS